MRVLWVTRAISTTPIRGIQRWFQASRRILSLHCVLGLPRAQNTCQGGILTSFPKHLNWFLSMWSSGSALISFWISECLALSLRLNPDTLGSKLISVACIPDPDDRWRLECRLAVKQRASLGAVSSSQWACLDPSGSVPLHFFCLLRTRSWTT